MMIRLCAVFALTSLITITSGRKFKKLSKFKNSGYSAKMPALGRNIELGCLYNRHKDQIIGGGSFIPWTQANLTNNTITSFDPKTEAEILYQLDIVQKAEKFGMGAEITASFMSGMIEVKGAAQYLNENPRGKLDYELAMKLHKATHVETISQDIIRNVDYDIFDNFPEATHVVNKIYYGANCVFSITQKADNESHKQSISGDLQAKMEFAKNKIDGKIGINVTDESKNNASNYQCKFSGDINVDRVPTTFESALQTMADLPGLINKTTSVPIFFEVIKISDIATKVDKLIREIKGNVMMDFRARVVEYTTLQSDIVDIKETNVYKKLRLFRKHIDQFESALKIHELKFKSKMKNILAKARKSAKHELHIMKILEEPQTVYDFHSLVKYLDKKEQEAAALAGLFWNPDLVLSEAGQREKLLCGKNKYLLVLTLQAYPENDPFLNCIKNESKPGCETPQYLGAWANSDTGDKQRGPKRREYEKTVKAILDNQNLTSSRHIPYFAILEQPYDPQSDNENGSILSINLYVDGVLEEKGLYLPHIEINLKEAEFNCSHFIVTWNYELTKNSFITTDTFTVRFRDANGNRTDWTHVISNVTDNTATIKMALLTEFEELNDFVLEVLILKDCLFGYCAEIRRNFSLSNHNSAKCLPKCEITDNCTKNQICDEEQNSHGKVIETKCTDIGNCKFHYGSSLPLTFPMGQYTVLGKYECCSLCKQNRNCVGFQTKPFNNNANQSHCDLYENANTTILGWDENIISGYIDNRLII